MPSVTRKSGGGRTRRGEAESNVFAAVERLLGKGGSYTEIGIQQISDEAGIGRSTFYVHFADKTDLLIRMTEAATEQLFGVVAQWVAEEKHDRDALEETLLHVIRFRREHDPALNALTEVAAYDVQVERFWRGMLNEVSEALTGTVTDDHARGLVRNGLDIPHTVRWLVWGIERYVGQHVRTAAASDDRALAAALAAGVWQLIYSEHDAPANPSTL